MIAPVRRGPSELHTSSQLMLMPGRGVPQRLPPGYFETSASKYFFEILVSVPSAASSPRALLMASVRLVDPLRSVNGAQRLVGGLGGDLDAGVVVGLLGVQVGQLVVDGGVDAALLEQRDRLRPPLHGLNVGAALLRQLVPVARQGLRRGLALEVLEGVDAVVVRLGDDHARAHRVRRGEIVLRLAFVGDGNLVGDDVEPLGVEAGEDGVELGLLEGRLDAQLRRRRR